MIAVGDESCPDNWSDQSLDKATIKDTGKFPGYNGDMGAWQFKG